MFFQAFPLIETLSLHELVDPRLGDSYSTYEIYNMARAAYLCVQTKPEMRPTIVEVHFWILLQFQKIVTFFLHFLHNTITSKHQRFCCNGIGLFRNIWKIIIVMQLQLQMQMKAEILETIDTGFVINFVIYQWSMLMLFN